MGYQLQYFDEVEIDVNDAKVWYKQQWEGLELEFASAIEKAIDYIINTPKAYAIRCKKVRLAHPKIFPYNIHFYIDQPNKIVVITAIVHNKRHQKKAI